LNPFVFSLLLFHVFTGALKLAEQNFKIKGAMLVIWPKKEMLKWRRDFVEIFRFFSGHV
jgi:hypothetical protein